MTESEDHRNNEPPPGAVKNGWAGWSALTSLVATVVIPVVLLVVGNNYAAALRERDVQGRFVELALSILREAPSAGTERLRLWATRVVDRFSGVPLSGAAEQLWRRPLGLSSGPFATVRVAPTFPQNIARQSFAGSVMLEPQFQQTKVDSCNFDHSTLLRPRFESSSLNGVSFVGAILPSADFRNASFAGADFSGANLMGADFGGAAGLNTIKWSPDCTCPDGSLAGSTGCGDKLVKYPWSP